MLGCELQFIALSQLEYTVNEMGILGAAGPVMLDTVMVGIEDEHIPMAMERDMIERLAEPLTSSSSFPVIVGYVTMKRLRRSELRSTQ